MKGGNKNTKTELNCGRKGKVPVGNTNKIASESYFDVLENLFNIKEVNIVGKVAVASISIVNAVKAIIKIIIVGK